MSRSPRLAADGTGNARLPSGRNLTSGCTGARAPEISASAGLIARAR
jgi:hypothetical protein